MTWDNINERRGVLGFQYPEADGSLDPPDRLLLLSGRWWVDLYGAAPPSAPTSLVAQLFAGPFIRLTWQDNSADETAFVIFRRVGNSGPFVEYDTTLPDVELWDDPGPFDQTKTYWYYVVARNANGDSAPSNTVHVAFLDTPLYSVSRFRWRRDQGN
ncbi:MAG: hypothetical protein AMS20_00245 [Gemmatimonas sp. SG8_28]|nr:MAG: hypothetical protein AMS20_00245 [Gemmatimonas sp. SG8_28]